MAKLMFKSMLSHLSGIASRLGWDRRANVAVTFALASIPIVGLVGAAIDYGHAMSVKATMQAALDSTALMVSKSASSLTSTQLQSNAQNYFKGLFSPPDASGVSVNAAYTTTGGNQVTVNASATVGTNFMKLLGYNNITINSSTTTSWGSSRLRVALVLDNTGSMAQSSKMTELKAATANLLTQLQNAVTTAGDVYVSIVPFVKDVDLGSSNYSGSWIYWGNSTQELVTDRHHLLGRQQRELQQIRLFDPECLHVDGDVQHFLR